MRSFHMMMLDDQSIAPRRVEFQAESPDHAFQVARNEIDGVHVELWEGKALLARMTKTADNVWKLLPAGDDILGAEHILPNNDDISVELR